MPSPNHSSAIDEVRSASETQRRLLDIARSIIATRGIQAIRMQDVANRAGVTTPAIYHHFKDRRDLIITVLAHSSFVEASSENIESYLADDYTGREAVLRALLDELPLTAKTRELAAIWGEVLALGAFEPAVQGALTEGLNRWRNSLIIGIEAGVADGSIAPDVEAPLTADILIALTDGYCRLCLADVVEGSQAMAALTRAVTALLAPSDPAQP